MPGGKRSGIPDPNRLTNPKPFNPLELRTLAESMVTALLRHTVEPLDSIEPFEGAGIYVIYYTGAFAPYEAVASANRSGTWNRPLYVGEAERKGARKGGFLSERPPGKAIYDRLKQHANSIRAASNLNIKDFWCRYLVTEDVFIPLCESLLIDRYSPVWNTVIEGFGINPTGKNRAQQQTSTWDILHPGRPNRGLQQNKKFKSDEEVKEYLKVYLAR